MSAPLPSTLLGPGWSPRVAGQAEELAAGLWGPPAGLNSEVAPLREVLLTRPGPGLDFAEDPQRWLMDERPHLPTLTAQAQAIAGALAARGVQTTWIDPPQAGLPNLIFARDLFFMTPEGAVVARMAAQQRAGEERHAAAALAARGVPILATLGGHACFEGADALWLNAHTVLVGVGRRTNQLAFERLSRILADQSVQAVPVEVPETSQHLLGALIFVDEGRALTLRATPSIHAALAAHGVLALDLPVDEETVRGRAANLLTLAPGQVFMPAGNPRTQGRLEAWGIACETVEVGEYIKAAGALGCLAGPLHRALP